MTTATYTFDEHIVSDLHKDAYGFRPSTGWWNNWVTMNDDEKQQEWDSLIASMEAREASRIEGERQAVIRFETLVFNTLKAGAHNRTTAIRWLMQGEQLEDDSSFFEYLMGIPYGYIAKHS